MECEICKEVFTKTDYHHIISKSKGGCSKEYNLVSLCTQCHKQVHLGEIIIKGKFLTTEGYKLLFDEEDNGNCYIMGKQDAST